MSISLVRLALQFGPWRAVAVTSEAVAEWQLDLREDGYRDATINRFCQVLRQSFNLAIERKRLASGPVIKHLSEVGNERKGFFTEAEIRSVIAGLPEYLKDFVLFAYITGMRKRSSIPQVVRCPRGRHHSAGRKLQERRRPHDPA